MTNQNDYELLSVENVSHCHSSEKIFRLNLLCVSFATNAHFYICCICVAGNIKAFSFVVAYMMYDVWCVVFIYWDVVTNNSYFAHWTLYRQEIICVYWVRTYLSMTNFFVLSVAVCSILKHFISFSKAKKTTMIKAIIEFSVSCLITYTIAKEFPMHTLKRTISFDMQISRNTQSTFNESFRLYGKVTAQTLFKCSPLNAQIHHSNVNFSIRILFGFSFREFSQSMHD